MEVAERVAVSRVSVSLELSKLLLEVPERQQPGVVDGWSCGTGPIAVFDNLELLFTPKLRVDPLRWLSHHASRRTAVVAAWPGRLEGDRLMYATAGHPEHYESSVPQCRVINIADVVLRSVPREV